MSGSPKFLNGGGLLGMIRGMKTWLALPLAVLLGLPLPLALHGCAAGPTAAPIRQAEAEAVLTAQVRLWNGGDLPGFVATYWNGPELSFFGRSGLARGREDLLAAYRKSYPTAKERGALSFETLAFLPLGDGHALLLGRYRIVGEQPSSGAFSLVLARQDGRIVILHDHTTGDG
jgi:hypothetical protein